VLVTAKEEKAILDYWATDGEPTFVAASLGPVNPILIEEEVVCVELLVLDVEVC
jgi:hypothetical protein